MNGTIDSESQCPQLLNDNNINSIWHPFSEATLKFSAVIEKGILQAILETVVKIQSLNIDWSWFRAFCNKKKILNNINGYWRLKTVFRTPLHLAYILPSTRRRSGTPNITKSLKFSINLTLVKVFKFAPFQLISNFIIYSTCNIFQENRD